MAVRQHFASVMPDATRPGHKRCYLQSRLIKGSVPSNVVLTEVVANERLKGIWLASCAWNTRGRFIM